MTATVAAGASPRTWPLVDATAPPERLAAFRIAMGIFTVTYLVLRFPVFWQLADRAAADFEPVGVLARLGDPPAAPIVRGALVVALASGVAVVAGWRHRVSGPTCAVALLGLATLRGSWGQLLHFENLIVLHLAVIALSPAADAWSLDARHRETSAMADMADTTDTTESSSAPRDDVRYGWPLAMAGLITVVTYVIAGIAKFRYGGLDWISGNTLQNHIAYSATRLDLIGGTPPLLAEPAVRAEWLLAIFAALAVVIELVAPVVFVGPRLRTLWVAAAWSMHIGILLTMSVGFPSPIFGLAFAPLFRLERLVPPPVARRLDGRPAALR